jgi:YD repeat-containing protein
VTDTPGVDAGATVFADASVDQYSSFNSTSQSYAPQRDNHTVLHKTGANAYECTAADGSQLFFGASDGATTYPRRIYLTEVHDPAGNVLALSYTAGNRLDRITAADGKWLQFYYEDAAINPAIRQNLYAA